MTRNIVFNIVGTTISAGVGLITMPFLVQRLGFEGYGLWSLIGSMSAYLALLDFSVSPSLARLIATKRAKEDVEAINCLMSTALAMLILFAVLATAPMLIAADVFLPAFHVPAARQGDTLQAVIIMAVSLCAGFPLSIFQALRFGYERFDLENLIDILTVIGRAVLLFACIDRHSGLTEVALISAGSTLAGALASGVVSWRIAPQLRLRWSNVRWWAFRELYAYAVPYWTLMLTKTIPPQIGPFLIGYLFGGHSVATFTIARQLVSYGANLVSAAGRTTTPRAALLHAAGQKEAGKTLFINASRYALAMALTLTCGFVSFGDSFLDLWLGRGPGADAAYTLLVILAVGEAIPMSQFITASILSGRGSIVVLIVIGLLETVVLAVLSALLAGPYGSTGVCVAYAAAGFLVRGTIQMAWGCSIIGVGVRYYLSHVVLLVATAGAVPLLIGAAVGVWGEPQSFAQFVLLGIIYAVVQACFLVPFLLKLGTRWTVGRSLCNPSDTPAITSTGVGQA